MKKIFIVILLIFISIQMQNLHICYAKSLTNEDILEIEKEKKEMDDEAILLFMTPNKEKIDDIDKDIKELQFQTKEKTEVLSKKNRINFINFIFKKKKNKEKEDLIKQLDVLPISSNITKEEFEADMKLKEEKATQLIEEYGNINYQEARKIWRNKKKALEKEKQKKEMEVLGYTFWKRKPIHPIAKYGYKDTLPDISEEMGYKTSNNVYKNMQKLNTDVPKENLIPVPRENKTYVDVIIKKNKSSDYVNDINDVIKVLQKLEETIINGEDVQYFNALVSSLMDNVYYIQDKYKNKAESYYISYFKMLELADFARSIAELRSQARVYNKYLAYSGEGYIYRPENIQQQLEFLLRSVQETMSILKEVN